MSPRPVRDDDAAGQSIQGRPRQWGSRALPSARRTSSQSTNLLLPPRTVNRQSSLQAELQDFYLSILSATASKRDARSYIKRFTPPPVTRLPYAGLTPSTPRTPKNLTAEAEKRHEDRINRILEDGGASELFKPTGKSKVFVPKAENEELHVALVKIRDLDSVSDSTLRGVGRTLESLKRLGLVAIVVLDEPNIGAGWRSAAEAHAERMISAIEASRGKARRVDGALNTAGSTVTVSLPQLLLAPLSRGVIPVFIPAAFNPEQKVSHVDANEIVTSLTRLFSTQQPPEATADAQPVSLDRLIFLDPLGGIPAPDRPAGAHVFVNMKQEYDDIYRSLLTEGHMHHLRSFQTLRQTLSMLPPTTSAIITTPSSASASTSSNKAKNPLIHNLLTDKPVFSSSLPASTSPSTQTTLLKLGTPLKLFGSGTKLTDPSIDLTKLVALIEDSFEKTLDVDHYLRRVNDHIAGLIIAGDYDGAAIVTWETPPNTPNARRVCYLDKFAVAKRSQGVGGVADVVFKAMTAGVRNGGLFEGAEGIVWRSRRTNVVNKWYFERAKGTYKLPQAGDMWTMFWITEDAQFSSQRFKDYVDVCCSIEPSLR